MDEDYKKHYSEKSFREKMKRFARVAGREVVEKALVLFYALRDRRTPLWARGIITAALGYFVFPLDAIADLAPFVGYADDLGAVGVALATVAAYIQPEHWEKAKKQARKIFGEG